MKKTSKTLLKISFSGSKANYTTKRVSISSNNHSEDFMAYVTFDEINKTFNSSLN